MVKKDEKFKILLQKDIYELLEGSGSGASLVKFNGKEYGMPYYSATMLEKLCREFGVTDTLGGSRWNYVETLMKYAIENQRCDELFRVLFDETRFTNLQDIEDLDDVDKVYKQIIFAAIKQINHFIRLSRNKLVYIDGHFMIVENGKVPVIDTPKLNVRSIPYVQGLRERCKADFQSGNYDSVITKSRTMIEEILVQILEENSLDEITKGDVIKLYNQVKSINNMQQTSDKDKRVNSVLSGLERIVQSIAEMRNANSDAHGVGSKRITIRECEARLVMNSAITFCEYIISIHDKHYQP